MEAIQRTYADRPRRSQGPRISPLASFSAEAVSILAQRFALLPKDEPFVLNRALSLAIVSTDGTRVRVLRGIVQHQFSGGRYTLTDEDGFTVGSLQASQIVAWSTDGCDQLEAAASKTLHGIQTEVEAIFDAALEICMAELNAEQFARKYPATHALAMAA